MYVSHQGHNTSYDDNIIIQSVTDFNGKIIWRYKLTSSSHKPNYTNDKL